MKLSYFLKYFCIKLQQQNKYGQLVQFGMCDGKPKLFFNLCYPSREMATTDCMTGLLFKCSTSTLGLVTSSGITNK